MAKKGVNLTTFLKSGLGLSIGKANFRFLLFTQYF